MTALADSPTARTAAAPPRTRRAALVRPRSPVAVRRRGPVRGGPGPGQDRPVLAAAGPGRPRPRPRCGPAGSASRRRPGSAWSPRCRASGPRCTWTPPSPSRSASRRTPPTRCAPGWPREHWISARTRRFAKWSAICSFALGMAGQVAYHLLAQAGAARAPWAITTLVSCLPVLVLAMGTALAHMLRADAAAADSSDSRSAGPASERSPEWSAGDQPADQPDQDHGTRTTVRTSSPARTSEPARSPGSGKHHPAPTRS